MIRMRDAMRVVQDLRRDDVVLTTETSTIAWGEVAGDPTLDLPIPAMSKGSSVALGVALAQPHRRVILWDGDGSLLMNLGSLVTVAGKAPRNLYHIVLDNGMYAMTGGQPLPNAGRFSFEEMARAAGYPRIYRFEDLEEWTDEIGRILEEPGPALIVMATEPEITDWRNNPPRGFRRMSEAAPMARAALAGGDRPSP